MFFFKREDIYNIFFVYARLLRLYFDYNYLSSAISIEYNSLDYICYKKHL